MKEFLLEAAADRERSGCLLIVIEAILGNQEQLI